jgi:hypothetical protein
VTWMNRSDITLNERSRQHISYACMTLTEQASTQGPEAGEWLPEAAGRPMLLNTCGVSLRSDGGFWTNLVVMSAQRLEL